MVRILFFSVIFLCATQVVVAENKVVGIERAEGARLSAAVGHYSRARELLLMAVKEFDAGAKAAGPDLILDVDTWRSSVNARAADLEQILSPQARVTKDGVRYDADIKIFDNKK